MIYYCPYCGYALQEALGNGIAGCSNCSRVFDSSTYNKLLATSWYARRRNIWHLESLVRDCNLTKEEAEIIGPYICDEGYSHDEMLKLLNELKVA